MKFKLQYFHIFLICISFLLILSIINTSEANEATIDDEQTEDTISSQQMMDTIVTVIIAVVVLGTLCAIMNVLAGMEFGSSKSEDEQTIGREIPATRRISRALYTPTKKPEEPDKTEIYKKVNAELAKKYNVRNGTRTFKGVLITKNIDVDSIADDRYEKEYKKYQKELKK